MHVVIVCGTRCMGNCVGQIPRGLVAWSEYGPVSALYCAQQVHNLHPLLMVGDLEGCWVLERPLLHTCSSVGTAVCLLTTRWRSPELQQSHLTIPITIIIRGDHRKQPAAMQSDAHLRRVDKATHKRSPGHPVAMMPDSHHYAERGSMANTKFLAGGNPCQPLFSTCGTTTLPHQQGCGLA